MDLKDDYRVLKLFSLKWVGQHTMFKLPNNPVCPGPAAAH